MRAVIEHGGPCESKQDVMKLKRKLKTEKVDQKTIKETLKNEIRYMKLVRKRKGMNMKGGVTELTQMLLDNLPDSQSEEIMQAQIPYDPEEEIDEPQLKRPRLRQEEEETDKVFKFGRQGQWVAVYSTSSLKFKIGQVTDVLDENRATVTYLEEKEGRKDFFRFPLIPLEKETYAHLVFDWDFKAVPVNSYFCVPEVDRLQFKFLSIKERSRM